MSRANDMAFPAPQSDTPNNTIQCGLTVREHFAAMAMQGMLSCDDPDRRVSKEMQLAELTRLSVRAADALIAELAKVKP